MIIFPKKWMAAATFVGITSVVGIALAASYHVENNETSWAESEITSLGGDPTGSSTCYQARESARDAANAALDQLEADCVNSGGELGTGQLKYVEDPGNQYSPTETYYDYQNTLPSASLCDETDHGGGSWTARLYSKALLECIDPAINTGSILKEAVNASAAVACNSALTAARAAVEADGQEICQTFHDGRNAHFHSFTFQHPAGSPYTSWDAGTSGAPANTTYCSCMFNPFTQQYTCQGKAQISQAYCIKP